MRLGVESVHTESVSTFFRFFGKSMNHLHFGNNLSVMQGMSDNTVRVLLRRSALRHSSDSPELK